MDAVTENYRIIRSRRKTLAIEITPRGEILVRCPLRMANRDIARFVSEKQDWIRSHLARLSAAPLLPALTEEELQSLAEQARGFFPARTAHFAAILGVTYGRITIRSQHTRWGSCSAAGNLNFNCLLMLSPPQVRDYVVVHELCHRKEMNHSPRFWALVESLLPDYRRQKQWLKANGGALLARLPSGSDPLDS